MSQNKELILENLPTGKPHISFSEIKEWYECSYRHKLRFIEGIDLSVPSPIPDFGTAVHAACENFLKTKQMNVSIAHDAIKDIWSKHSPVEGYTHIDAYFKEATEILEEIPKFMSENFGDWSCLDAEHMLYEQIEDLPYAFKGYIDGVILTKNKKNQDIVWLLDWKTTNTGWRLQKKSDEMVKSQLIFYKNFWSKKMNVDPKNIRCAFVLLKRKAKIGAHCELFPVSVGEVTTKRALNVVDNMLHAINKNISIKNRYSCTYCNYAGTSHCP